MYRIRNLHRAYDRADRAGADGPRGIAPYQIGYFWKSGSLKCEAALLGGFFYLFDVLPVPQMTDVEEGLPDLARGERLCHAFDEFRALRPDSATTIEHAIMLLVELIRGVEIALARCNDCRALVVRDRLAIVPPLCAFCSHERNAGLPRFALPRD